MDGTREWGCVVVVSGIGAKRGSGNAHANRKRGRESQSLFGTMTPDEAVDLTGGLDCEHGLPNSFGSQMNHVLQLPGLCRCGWVVGQMIGQQRIDIGIEAPQGLVN